MASQTIFLALAISMMALTMPVYGQITTSCTPSMLTTFSPCINFIMSNSSGNGTAPSSDCCNSLRTVMSNGTDCLCLIATGTVPNLQNIPINRTLAVSLPRACNMPGVPLQCKAASAPVPAPGPAALSPTPASAPTGSTVPESVAPTLAPEADANPALTPPTTTAAAGAPTTNTGSRPVLTPSGATKSSHGVSSFLLLFVLGATILKYY